MVLLLSAVQRLARIVAEGTADQALIVVPDEARVPRGDLPSDGVNIVKLSQLPSYLVESLARQGQPRSMQG